MTIRELTSKFSDEFGTKNAESRACIDFVIGEIEKAIVSEGGIHLPGLGTFNTVIRNERKQFNPSVNSVVTVPEHIAVKFKASKKLQNDLKQLS